MKTIRVLVVVTLFAVLAALLGGCILTTWTAGEAPAVGAHWRIVADDE